MAIEPALLYTLKGTGTILDAAGTKVQGYVNSNYVELPFLLRLYLTGGLNLVLGPQFSYHVSSTFDLEVDNTKVVDGEDVTDTVSEFGLAPVAGLGYEFDNCLNLNLTGEFGMLTVDGMEVLRTFNRTIRLSVGYSF